MKRNLLLLRLLPGALLINACAKPDPVQVAPILSDPAVATIGAAAPATTLVPGGSFFFGEGWAPPQIDRQQPLRWQVGLRSTIYFSSPRTASSESVERTSDLVLHLHARPFSWAEAPLQRLTVFDGTRVVGRFEFSGAGWQDVEIPLSGLGAGFLELEIEAAYAKSPRSLGLNPDRRELAFAVRKASVSAGGSAPDLVDPLPAESGLLGPGLSLTLPIPAHSEIELRTPSDKECLFTSLITGENRPIQQSETGELRATTGNRAALLRVANRCDEEAPLQELLAQMSVNRLQSPPQLVMVYLIDTLRADVALDPGIAPNIAAFTQDALTFPEAWSSSSWTLPALASLLSGMYPSEHGVMDGSVHFDADRHTTLQSLLSERGFRTLNLSNSFINSSRFGLSSGFDSSVLDDQLNAPTLRTEDLRGHLLERLIFDERIEQSFVLFHTVGPHAPYNHFPLQELENPTYSTPHQLLAQGVPVTQESAKSLRARYVEEVRYADREFGRMIDLLRYMGYYEDALILLISDHGEEFGEHGGLDHGRTLFEEQVAIPFVLKLPGNRHAGMLRTANVSLVDVLPTIADVLGIGATPAAGTSVLLHLQSDPNANSEEGLAQSIVAELQPVKGPIMQAVDLTALRFGRQKCIFSGLDTDRFGQPIEHWRAYDLNNDPLEFEPLGRSATAFRSCIRKLDAWLETNRWNRDTEAGSSVSEEAWRRLRALGYVE